MLKRALKIMVLLLLLTYFIICIFVKKTVQILTIRTLYEVLQIIFLQYFKWDEETECTYALHNIRLSENIKVTRLRHVFFEMTFTELEQIFLQANMSGVSIVPIWSR